MKSPLSLQWVRQGMCQMRQDGRLFWQILRVNEQHFDLSIWEVKELQKNDFVGYYNTIYF
jgi:hypothetical protein